jgi:hypothetical protein
MHIHHQPTPASINIDPQIQDRFWYWHGGSGQRYIHSAYPADRCPLLPGAVYLSVRKLAEDRFVPLAVETCSVLDGIAGFLMAADGADEVHVHLLADTTRDARKVRDDLKTALGEQLVFGALASGCAANDGQYSLFGARPDEAPAAA